MSQLIEPHIIVHGGAWDIPADLHEEHIEGIQKALKAGQQELNHSDNPIQAVIAAIRAMEDFPAFDAGTGSFLNNAGEVEMDAGIMNGEDLTCGAVAAVRNVQNPILLADLVRTHSQHCLLAGEGAYEFAVANNIQICPTENLLVGREKERYLELQARPVKIKTFFENHNKMRDTVGAVVINSSGQIAAGTSTGGTPMKLQGRVGDTPLPGAGYYADDGIGGFSATGWGEGIMRVMLCREASYQLNRIADLAKSLTNSLELMKNRVNGQGGLIGIDVHGQVCYDHTTPYMAVGAADTHNICFAKISTMREK